MKHPILGTRLGTDDENLGSPRNIANQTFLKNIFQALEIQLKTIPESEHSD